MSRHRSHGWGPWGFGTGFGRRGRFFEPGEVRLALLSLLGEGPKHGYQLMKELEDRSGGSYRASAGTVYPTLQQLEDEGMIELMVENGKRVYRITEAGRAELADNQEAVERIWRRAGHWEEWGQFAGLDFAVVAGEAGDLMRAALAAVRRAQGERDRLDRIRTILQQTRRDLDDL